MFIIVYLVPYLDPNLPSLWLLLDVYGRRHHI